MNLDTILTALGIVSVPSGAGVKAFLSLRDRVAKVESAQTADSDKQDIKHEVLLVKLDAISDKIDLRCDALEGRVGRIERSMNGYLKHD